MSDRALGRLVRGVVLVLVLGVPLFGLRYYLDQRVSSGPGLADRQVATAEQRVRTAPDNITYRLALAEAYRADKRLSDALKQYDEVLRVQPTHRAALMGRGAVLLARGDLPGATAAYRKVVATNGTGEFAGADPQLEEAHYRLAEIALERDALSLAATELGAALRIDDTDADAWYLLGTVRVRDGAPQDAVAAFRRALLFVPTGWCEPYQKLVSAYQALGRAAEAEYAGAMVDFCQDRPDVATRRLTALVRGPAAVDALLGLGMVAESTGARDDAVAWYRKVLAREPRNAAAVTALSRLGVTASPAPKPSPTSSSAGSK